MATLIYNVTDLQNMANDLNGTYELANDIDGSPTAGWNGGAGFVPVGQSSPWFTGSFDGKAYKISDLYINRPTEEDVGLFGRCTGATLTDVILEDFDVRGHTFVGALAGECNTNNTVSDVHATESYVEGQHYLGGLVGWISYDTQTDCDYQGTIAQKERDWNGINIGGFAGNIASSTILRCFANVTVTSESISSGIGGFAGVIHIDCNIDQCYSQGSVYVSWFSNKFYSNDFRAGGFAGHIAYGSDVNDCYSRANVIVDTDDYGTGLGGFAGEVSVGALGIVDNVYSTGSVSGGTGVDKGGLVGKLASGSVTDSFWDKETSGLNTSAAGTGKTTAQMKTKATFTDAGWNFTTIWDISPSYNNGYPILRQLPTQSGVGGFLWIEATTLAYTDENGQKRVKEGTKAGATGQTSGHVWVEGNNLRYIDSSGDERYIVGTLDGATGKTAGIMWIELSKLRYIDSSGNERYIEGT